jgi:hypothetical protein
MTGAVPETATWRPATVALENPITGSNGDPLPIVRLLIALPSTPEP